jgi:tetratricopeptide (TPR) repeat protein
MNQGPAKRAHSARATRRDSQISTVVSGGSNKIFSLAICLLLALAVWVVFGRTPAYEFVNFDDDAYVYENTQVSQGLSLKGVEWAFTHSVKYNWHPLTMMSYMLDYQFYGLKAGGYHLTNVLLHGAAAILLFLTLQQMTGALWRSAFVAALFAVHPLHVESVAWVAERKDVLSGLFFMLTLGAYVWYAREPRRWSRYLAVIFLFALALMSKPTVIPLPFVLLLLDYWPLNRWRTTGNDSKSAHLPGKLFLEKIPLFALSAAGCLATLASQEKIIAPLPLALRLNNAWVSVATYLWQLIYPLNLAAYYPLTEQGLTIWEIVASLLVLVLISTLAYAWRRKQPWLLVGWLWYLIMLLPVIGLVQSGLRAHADRYTYLPQIGLYLSIAWMATRLVAGWRQGRLLLGTLASAVIVSLIFCSRAQVPYWKNSEVLWEHTLAVTGDSDLAHNNLGLLLVQQGRLDEAIAQYQRALQANPGYIIAYNNLGLTLAQQGRWDEAIARYQQALKINPGFDMAHYNLGNVLLQQGRLDEAMAEYQQALRANPDNYLARYNLGNALVRRGRLDEAISQYQQTLKISPDYAPAHINLGNALLQRGRLDEAIFHYEQALKISPDDDAENNLGLALLLEGKLDEAVSHYQRALEMNPGNAGRCQRLAWRLATHPQTSLRRGDKAVKLAQQLNRLSGTKDPVILQTLAAAYAETKQFPEAISAGEQALQLASARNNTALVSDLHRQITDYQAGQPFRDTSLTDAASFLQP